MSTPSPLLGGGVFHSEGFAATPLTLALPGESEGKPHRGAALRKQNPPSWEGGGGGHTPTL